MPHVVIQEALDLSVASQSIKLTAARYGSEILKVVDVYSKRSGCTALVDCVVVITGATSGLGFEAARVFAQMDATVEIIARNATKAAATCDELRQKMGNQKVGFVVADTGDLAEFRCAASDLAGRHTASVIS